jgi:hypothetical protein
MILCSRYRKRIDALIEHRVAMQSFIQSVSSKSGATMQQSLGIIAMRHTSSAVQCSAVQCNLGLHQFPHPLQYMHNCLACSIQIGPSFGATEENNCTAKHHAGYSPRGLPNMSWHSTNCCCQYTCVHATTIRALNARRRVDQ